MKYVLKYPDGQYVHIDQTSGGYPQRSDWWGLTVFNTISKALKYRSHFKEEKWDLYEVEGLNENVMLDSNLKGFRCPECGSQLYE